MKSSYGFGVKAKIVYVEVEKEFIIFGALVLNLSRSQCKRSDS